MRLYSGVTFNLLKIVNFILLVHLKMYNQYVSILNQAFQKWLSLIKIEKEAKSLPSYALLLKKYKGRNKGYQE